MPDETNTYEPHAVGGARPPAAAGLFGPPAAAGEVGTLGPYRVARQLGKGGMGAVYLAFDQRLGRKVALKVMLPAFAADPAAKGRFLREARAAAQITHDHVVIVHEADERDGVPYMTMQFLEGHPLNEYLKAHGRLSVPQAVRVAREVALGLAAAHARGLIHRDIKPHNLWLETPNGRVKVLDFGLAKPLDADTELSASGAIVGTPAYMSPEQAAGEKVDARTDLFSLGAVLYQLVTGNRPFDGPTTMAVLMALANKEPPPVRDLNPEVPEPLVELIGRLLAKNPAGRPATAAEVAERLDAIADHFRPSPTESMSAPQVVYVPIQVAPQPEVSVFAGLGAPEDDGDGDTTEAAGESSVARARPEPARPPGGRGPLLIAAAVAVAAVVVVGVALVVTNRNKGGTRGDPPADNAGAALVPAPGPKPAPRPKLPPPVEDADRAAARAVLATGAAVNVNGDKLKELKTEAELPREPFRLTGAVFRDEQASDAVLEKLKGCTRLEVINLRGKGVTNAGLAHLKGCTALRELMLDDTAATDAGLAAFADCTQLVILVLRGPFTDAGLAHLKNSTGIMQANLQWTQAGDGTVAQLARNKGLVLLYLSGPNVTDAGLAPLADCRALLSFALECPNVTEAGLAHLANCVGVHDLSLHGPNVTGAWLRRCRGMTDLRQVALTRSLQITDGDLEALPASRELGDVYLEGTGVTDAGLKHLAALPKVRLIVLRKTKVTKEGVEWLAKALPACKIEWDGPTILPTKP